MTTITLPPNTEAKLRREAERRGIDAVDFARELIERGLPADAPDKATLDLLAKWDREQATDDAAEIGRRRENIRAFKEAMNRGRLEMEGPDARRVFP